MVMKLHTGLGFCIGALGVLLSRRDHSLGRLSLPTPAGDMLRSALSAAVITPLLIAWIMLLGAVADTGCDTSKADRPRVFGKFRASLAIAAATGASA